MRKCPCGKSEATLPCREDVPCCRDICGKTLKCGIHKCLRQCHKGDCGSCSSRSTATCACGAFSKEVLCGSSLFCERRCQKTRDCGRHTCSKRCCTTCPPCPETCGRLLTCKIHRCEALCHIGLLTWNNISLDLFQDRATLVSLL